MKNNFITFNAIVFILTIFVGAMVNPSYKSLLIFNDNIKNPHPYIEIKSKNKKKMFRYQPDLYLLIRQQYIKTI